MGKHCIQYRASGRAKSGSKEFGVQVYFRLDVEGENLQEARKNGLPLAETEAPTELLKEAKKRFSDAELIRVNEVR